MKLNDITVILAAYNSSQFIEEAINSIFHQTMQPREVIVIDDGSSDDTAEIVKKIPRIIYIHQEHRGVSSARNKGLQLATSGWVAFLDSDDIWAPEHLEKVMSVILRHSLVWSCGAMRAFGAGTAETAMPYNCKRILGKGQIFSDFFEAFAVPVHFPMDGMIIKKEVITQAGLFDESLKNHVDYDLFFRIAFKYPEIGFIRPATLFRRIRKGSISYGKRINALLLLKKYRMQFSATDSPRQKGYRLTTGYLLRQTIIAAIETQDMGLLEKLSSEQADSFKGYRLLMKAIKLFPCTSRLLLGLMKSIKRAVIYLLWS